MALKDAPQDTDDRSENLIEIVQADDCLCDLQQSRRSVCLFLSDIIQAGILNRDCRITCKGGRHRLGLVTVPAGRVMAERDHTQRLVTQPHRNGKARIILFKPVDQTRDPHRLRTFSPEWLVGIQRVHQPFVGAGRIV